MAVNRCLIYYLLWICGSLFLKGADCHETLTEKLVQRKITKTLAPLSEITERINNAILEVEDKKEGIKEYHRDIFKRVSEAPKKCLTNELQKNLAELKNWDFDSCVAVTDDLVVASDLAYLGGVLASNLTESVFNSTRDSINCPLWYPEETAQCINGNLKIVKEELSKFENYTVPIVQQSTNVLRTLRVDFAKCIGIPVTNEIAIEKHLQMCS